MLRGSILKFQKYVLARRSASFPLAPPAIRKAALPAPLPPTVAPPSPTTSSANFSFHRKLEHLERKVDALAKLIRCFMTGEEAPSGTGVIPKVIYHDVLEPFASATLA